MTKRVFLIHGWEGYPEEGWRPWLKSELEKRGFNVFIPTMPDTKYPKMDAWLKHLTEIVGTSDKDCYFVGHSLGCITILRYLETLKENQEVGGVILVAGFTSNLGYEELESFFTKPISWQEIKSHCKKFVAIHSDNDPYVSLHYGDFFKEKLNAKIFVEHKMRHFSGDDGITELPVVLNNLLIISSSIKKLKFADTLVPLVLSGEKTLTWRLFDDKNLSKFDVLEFINAGDGKSFAFAEIVEVVEKKFGDLTPEDREGHESFESKEEMYKTYEKYYNKRVDSQTLVKIVRFRSLEKF